MPLYHYTCPSCRAALRRILNREAAKRDQRCPTCSAVLVRAPSAPSTSVVERLDNGHMPRAVERPAEAERLFRERSKIDPSKG